MTRRALCFSVVSAALTVPIAVSCSDPSEPADDGGGVLGGSGGASTTGGTAPGAGRTPMAGGTSVFGGAPNGGTSNGGASGASVTAGSAGVSAAGMPTTAGTGTGGSAGMGRGGAPGAGTGGARGGMGGKGGAGGSGVVAGAGGMAPAAPLDCGAKGTALENHGPPANRVNYVIVGDGYSEAQLQPNGTLDQHLQAAMTKRFSANYGQPYLRYRKFVNICVLRIPSTAICGSSTFGCCGTDSSRLASCDNTRVTNAIRDNIPASFEIDWRAVVLNGSSWWNSGGALMMWSGGSPDAGGAALHEGGHGHNQLSDEYGNCEQSRVSREAAYGVNVSLTNGMSGGKWDGWIGYNQTPGTGMQGFFACDGGGTWRPSENSVMNSLFDDNTAFNPVSREKIVMDIWRAVQTPYDSVTPAAGAVTNPGMLTVNVIDPAVISVDWSVDGTVVGANMGPTFNASTLSPGTHMVSARAYDNAGMDLVRQVPGTTFYRQFWGSGAMGHSDKTVTWTVTIQ
jgi:hypothetical protein